MRVKGEVKNSTVISGNAENFFFKLGDQSTFFDGAKSSERKRNTSSGFPMNQGGSKVRDTKVRLTLEKRIFFTKTEREG